MTDIVVSYSDLHQFDDEFDCKLDKGYKFSNGREGTESFWSPAIEWVLSKSGHGSSLTTSN